MTYFSVLLGDNIWQRWNSGLLSHHVEQLVWGAGHQVWFGIFMSSMRALGRCEELATRFGLVLLWRHCVHKVWGACHRVWFGIFMTSMRTLGRCEELATRVGLVFLWRPSMHWVWGVCHQVWFGNFMTSLCALGVRSLPPGLVWYFFITSLRAIGARRWPPGLVWYFYDVIALGWPRKWLLYLRCNLLLAVIAKNGCKCHNYARFRVIKLAKLWVVREYALIPRNYKWS
jgi:hypothetical protein